jgi:hypothetical protein
MLNLTIHDGTSSYPDDLFHFKPFCISQISFSVTAFMCIAGNDCGYVWPVFFKEKNWQSVTYRSAVGMKLEFLLVTNTTKA